MQNSNYNVIDDEGFLGVIDPAAYQGFVGEDATLERLMNRFRNQMLQNSLLIWGTGCESVWKVQVNFQITQTPGFREITGPIYVSQDHLCFTNYSELSMAASDELYTLPDAGDNDWIFPIASGSYRCRIVQLSDPDDLGDLDDIDEDAIEDDTNEDIDFLVEFERVDTSLPAWTTIPWSDLGETTL